MREFLLYSQIPAARESQLLNVFAGLTGTQPVSITEQTLIYQQVKVPEVAVSKKQQQSKQAPRQKEQLSYHKLVRSYTITDGKPDDIEPWTFRAETLPEPGITAYVSRDLDQHTATEQELARLKSPEWYRVKRQLIATGNRFIHGNVVIRIYRLEAPSVVPTDPTSAPPPSDLSVLRLLDRSGSFIVEASVRVEDGNNSSLNEQGKKELLDFKVTMDGAVDLIAPDRLSLDNRVKN